MNRSTLISLIERYIATQVHAASEKKLLQALFLGDGDTSFISLWKEYGGDYHAAVRESVKACRSDKGKVIDRYKKLMAYLKRNGQADIAVDWPPVDVSSRLDRLVYIMKALQTNPPDAVQFLSDKLFMSTRTIEAELSSLRYADAASPVSFLDQSFVINGIDRANGSVRFLSSVHPMLLMENLTGVCVMIQALLEKAQTPAYRRFAMVTAGHAWHQLTDYAQTRVEQVIRETYGSGSPVLALFEELKCTGKSGGFINEEEIAQDTVSKALFCIKARLNCRFLCREQDGALREHVGRPFDIGTWGESIGIRHDDGREGRVLLSTVERCEILRN